MINSNRGKRSQRPASFRRPTGRTIQEPLPIQQPEITEWGSTTLQNDPQCLRIGFLNVGCLPQHNPHPKQDALHHHILNHHFDILGLSEVGLNWSLLPRSKAWHERTYKIFRQLSTILAWNQTDIHTSPIQWGGTALLTMGLTTSRIHSRGKGPKKLGRWCWTTYMDKQGAKLTIYSIYRPVPNMTGPLSVYQQHRTQLLSSHSSISDPLRSFDTELLAELQSRIQSGEHLVIGGDINSNVTNSSIATQFEQLGLRETILNCHGGQPPPFSSHIRNDNNKIIDGIWTTSSVTILRSGYTSFHNWDHRTPWIDLQLSTTLGTPHLHNTQRFSGRRLRLSHPDSVHNYLRHLVPSVRHQRLLERARLLNSAVSSTLTTSQIEELETIDTQRTTAMLAAETKCRKLRLGKVPYSPQLIHHALSINFWKLQLKKHKGHNVSSRLLQRKRHQAQIPPQSFSDLSIHDIQLHIQHHRRQWNQKKRKLSNYGKNFWMKRLSPSQDPLPPTRKHSNAFFTPSKPDAITD